MLSVFLAVLASASNALSSVLQRRANHDEVADGGSGLGATVRLLRRPIWLAGLSAVIIGFALQAGALATGRLTVVQPLLAFELPLTLVLASRVFRSPLGRREWTAIVTMTSGLALLLYGLDPHGGAPAAAGLGQFALIGGGTVAAIAVLAGVGLISHGERRAAVLGIATGVCFALTAVFMDAALAGGIASVLARWQLYAMALTGLSAMLFLQAALQAGTLAAAQPGVTLSDPVVAVILGVLLFHEQVRSGWWVVAELLAAAAIGWSALQLSRSADTSANGRADDGRAPCGNADSAPLTLPVSEAGRGSRG